MDKYQITVNTFNKLADKYQAKYMDFDFYYDTYDRFCQLLTTPNATIFELGCGPGNISRYLLDKRPDFTLHGTDLAANMVKLAQANNPAATFSVLDCRDLTTVAGQFDGIICGFCLPYISKSDIETLIVTLREKLKLGGMLYLSTMEDSDQRSGFQTSSAGDQVYIHYHQFEHLAKLLVTNQCKIIEVQRKQFPVESGDPVTDLFIYAQAI